MLFGPCEISCFFAVIFLVRLYAFWWTIFVRDIVMRFHAFLHRYELCVWDIICFFGRYAMPWWDFMLCGCRILFLMVWCKDSAEEWVYHDGLLDVAWFCVCKLGGSLAGDWSAGSASALRHTFFTRFHAFGVLMLSDPNDISLWDFMLMRFPYEMVCLFQCNFRIIKMFLYNSMFSAAQFSCKISAVDFATWFPYEISWFFFDWRFAYEISCFLAVTRFPYFLVRFFAA